MLIISYFDESEPDGFSFDVGAFYLKVGVAFKTFFSFYCNEFFGPMLGNIFN